MKLFDSAASPYVRKINVLLHELGASSAVVREPVATTAFNSSETLIAANPLGKIPALEIDDGRVLYDSRVISMYLNEHFGGAFYPEDNWQTKHLEAAGDGIMDCTVSMAYEVRLRPVDEQSAQWIEAQWTKAARAIRALNTTFIDQLSGPLTMGHISVACALAYIDFRHDARQWRSDNDALAAWFTEMNARSSMEATAPKG
ncbi:MAG: glutathione S-transferase family protein [Paracoccaceae bacterium]